MLPWHAEHELGVASFVLRRGFLAARSCGQEPRIAMAPSLTSARAPSARSQSLKTARMPSTCGGGAPLCRMPDVRRLCLIAVIAISPLVIVASFGGCGSSGNADGGSDATTSPDTNDNDAGNTMMCSCPAADAALFNPNGTTCCAGSSCVAQHTD